MFPVRGMMYYKKALELQAFLDMAKDEGIFFLHCWYEIELFIYFLEELVLISEFYFRYADLMKGYKAAELMSSENYKSQRSLWAQCTAMTDMKFSYVVSCQQYGIQKRSRDQRATDILNLMIKYV